MVLNIVEPITIIYWATFRRQYEKRTGSHHQNLRKCRKGQIVGQHSYGTTHSFSIEGFINLNITITSWPLLQLTLSCRLTPCCAIISAVLIMPRSCHKQASMIWTSSAFMHPWQKQVLWLDYSQFLYFPADLQERPRTASCHVVVVGARLQILARSTHSRHVCLSLHLPRPQGRERAHETSASTSWWSSIAQLSPPIFNYMHGCMSN
jgi:hypothetical protein